MDFVEAELAPAAALDSLDSLVAFVARTELVRADIVVAAFAAAAAASAAALELAALPALELAALVLLVAEEPHLVRLL